MLIIIITMAKMLQRIWCEYQKSTNQSIAQINPLSSDLRTGQANERWIFLDLNELQPSTLYTNDKQLKHKCFLSCRSNTFYVLALYTGPRWWWLIIFHSAKVERPQ